METKPSEIRQRVFLILHSAGEEWALHAKFVREASAGSNEGLSSLAPLSTSQASTYEGCFPPTSGLNRLFPVLTNISLSLPTSRIALHYLALRRFPMNGTWET